MSSAMTETTKPLPRRRRRPAFSCIECRRRKIKCNRERPCNHCIVSDRACTYAGKFLVSTNDSNTGPAVSPVGVLGHKVRPTPDTYGSETHPSPYNIDWESTANRSSITASSHHTQSSATSIITTPTTSLEDDAGTNFFDCGPALPCKTGHVDIVSNGHSHWVSYPKTKGGSILFEDHRSTLNKTRLYGQTHWKTPAFEFRHFTAFLNDNSDTALQPEVQRFKIEVHASFAKCKQLAKECKVTRPSRHSIPSTADLTPPPREIADELIELYFTRFESVFRVMHVPSARTDYEVFWTSCSASCMTLKLKVLLMMAIGSSIYRCSQDGATIRNTCRAYVYAAQAWLSGPLEKDRLSFGGLQVHCLLLIARQMLSVGGDLIWVSTGHLIRNAMQIGLHRDPRQFRVYSVFQSELRRRLWATILELDVQAALDTGMPPSIDLDDYDTEEPANVNDEDINSSSTAICASQASVVTDTSLQLLFQRSLVARNDLLRGMNKIRSTITYEDVLSLSSKIDQACRELRNMDLPHSTQVAPVFRYNLADFLLRRFLLGLHRPYAVKARQNRLFYYSRKVCVDVGSKLLEPHPDADFAHLVLVGGGMWKARMLHCGLAVSSEMLADIEEEGKANLSRAVKDRRDILLNAVKAAQRQAAERIKFGETNVRSHMVFSMVVRRAESPTTISAADLDIAQAAKESLETSLSVLQARVQKLHAESALPDSINVDEALPQTGFDMDFDLNDFLSDTACMDGPFSLGLMA